jgi:hypothetical protein
VKAKTSKTEPSRESRYGFVNKLSGQPINRSRQGKLTEASEETANDPILKRSPFNSPTLDDFVCLITTHYVPQEELRLALSSCSRISNSRICGAWVAVLPELTAEGSPEDALSVSVKALGSSIIHYHAKISQSAPNTAEAYGVALQKVRKGLMERRNSFQAGLTGAIMCLSLTEVLISFSK